ncbi:MAG: DUF2958 domain-containing protein [Lysobacterales bacterium]|nr:MAG: DUF2958 domain-containing protein [Xanthomonadales bacterium]
MRLITKAVAVALAKADKAFVESEDGVTTDEIAVKFFNPCGAATWWIVRGTPLDEHGEIMMDAAGDPDYSRPMEAADWHLFGFCDLGDRQCAELGYTLLSQLQEIRGPFGLGIERDRYFTGSLKAVMAGYGYGKPETVKIEVQAIAVTDNLHYEDGGVAGVYNFNVVLADFPDRDSQYEAALDAFHFTVPVKMLEDFNFLTSRIPT